jgi:hypothetical protein
MMVLAFCRRFAASQQKTVKPHAEEVTAKKGRHGVLKAAPLIRWLVKGW